MTATMGPISEIQNHRGTGFEVSRQVDDFFVGDLPGIVFERFLFTPGVESGHVDGSDSIR